MEIKFGTIIDSLDYQSKVDIGFGAFTVTFWLDDMLSGLFTFFTFNCKKNVNDKNIKYLKLSSQIGKKNSKNYSAKMLKFMVYL